MGIMTTLWEVESIETDSFTADGDKINAQASSPYSACFITGEVPDKYLSSCVAQSKEFMVVVHTESNEPDITVTHFQPVGKNVRDSLSFVPPQPH